MMETSTEPLNGTMWLGHSSSPTYQRLSPPVRHDGRDISVPQQVCCPPRPYIFAPHAIKKK